MDAAAVIGAFDKLPFGVTDISDFNYYYDVYGCSYQSGQSGMNVFEIEHRIISAGKITKAVQRFLIMHLMEELRPGFKKESNLSGWPIRSTYISRSKSQL